MSASSKRGKLYLGREYDLKKGAVTDQDVLYDVRHLTTHGVILGMTGSGKTGLGIIFLEEILLQGIPVLILDPKGDIANLLLTFPDLQAADFQPWVDVDGAQRRGVSVPEFAAEEAAKWEKGLAEWGVSGDRIAKLRQAAEFTIFTPGSEAGQPVDVLHFFEAPDLDWDDHEEALRERIGGIVSALLGLVGVDADPLKSPEHILLARIIEHVWRAGDKLDLPTIIKLLQEPPFSQVGVFELETFFPEKERFALARTLNNLVAAPGFENWKEGMPLDVEALLFAEDGRPRASIFYMAHLNDAQRLFFITLFLESVRDWLRAQSGTTDLRAMLYFDELFGYFPPHPANPPTKTPLLALVKQGRAAGLGVVLATQNPADLDYKGLTNAGTWAIGALRADRDKERVLEGLEGATAEAGSAMDRRTIDKALGALKPRVFLIHDIREGKPVFFHTRWAMSYLCGPLTRKQVRQLSGGGSAPTPSKKGKVRKEAAPEEKPKAAAASSDASAAPPALPPSVPQVFLPPTVTLEWALRQYQEEVGKTVLVKERQVVYTPYLLALGEVRFFDQKRGVNHQEMMVRLVTPEAGPQGIDWERGEAVVDEDELSAKPVGDGLYEPVPADLVRTAELKRLEKEFSDYVYYNASVTILHNPTLKVYGQVGETERDFRLRCEKEARDQRDAELKKARAKMDKQIARVQKRLRKEKRELDTDEEELAARKREEILTIGESALNLLTGRRSSTMISRSSRKRTLVKKAEADVEESEEEIADLEGQLEDLKAEWEEQVADMNDRWAETLDDIQEHQVTPRRTDVKVQFCGLAWVPAWQVVLESGVARALPARE